MFRKIQRIHFVGIGGIGMSGLAELLHNQGYRVSGSDLREGPALERLRSLGVTISIGHDAAHVRDADVIVYSSAVIGANPELAEAERRKVPAIPRAEMLAEVMRLKHGVAVAGSHGKTTTTSLIAHVLHVTGLDPTAVIGGRVLAGEQDRTGARLGQGELLVAEADESDGSFLRLGPVIAVITNIDPEHLDHYGSFERVQEAFLAFANRVPFWGLTVACLDHPGIQAIVGRFTRRTVTYGSLPQADLVAAEVAPDPSGSTFVVRRGTETLGKARIELPGRHNVHNALACLAVALELDVPFARAAEALESFPGIERRFEAKGEHAGVRLVDDYAHHPAEIRATLAAARQTHTGRVVAVFQPHRYTRTRDLFDDFATAFHEADLLIVTDIYPAGEPPIAGVDAESLTHAIREHGHRDVRFVAGLDAVPAALVPELHRGDLVLTLGAGSISGLAAHLQVRLEEKHA